MSFLANIKQEDKVKLAKKVVRTIKDREPATKKLSKFDIAMSMITEIQHTIANSMSITVEDIVDYLRERTGYYGDAFSLAKIKRQDNYGGEREYYNLLNRISRSYKYFKIFFDMTMKVMWEKREMIQ